MFSVPRHSCSGPGNVGPRAQARCCATNTRCAPAALSCPPLPAGPADATGSPVWQWPPTGEQRADAASIRDHPPLCDTLLYPSAQFGSQQFWSQ